MRIIKFLMIIGGCLPGFGLKAAIPNWTVNPASYTYTMNITAKLNAECVELQNAPDMLGAFVNGVCRGVVNSSSVVNGNYLAFLTVYSNISSGELVEFQIYDASTDSVYIAATAVVFQDGAAYGFPTSPYTVYSNNPPTDIQLSDSTVNEKNANPLVGKLSTTDLDPQTHTYALVAGNGDTDNNDFFISGDSLYTVGSFDFDTKTTYSLRVETSDGTCTFQKVLRIFVNDSSQIPSDIFLSSYEINENHPQHAIVGTLTTADGDKYDTHHYALVNGAGDTDNGRFFIDSALLRLNVLSDFEIQDFYAVRILSTDESGGTIEKALVITVNDMNEKPFMFDENFEISEHANIGEETGTLRYLDPDKNDSHTLQVLGTNLFSLSGSSLQVKSVLDYEKEEKHEFEVLVTDAAGLTDTAEITVHIRDEVETAAPLPVNEILSPNNDGFNDFFTIANVEIYSDYSLRIFNEAGLVIFEADSHYNNSWAGTYNGDYLESGVYYYLFQNNADNSQYFKGLISIIR